MRSHEGGCQRINLVPNGQMDSDMKCRKNRGNIARKLKFLGEDEPGECTCLYDMPFKG